MISQYFLGTVSDNKDPDKLHRIQVTISGKQDSVSEWIPVISPYGGSDTGLYMLPDVGEQVVIISFDADHKQKAIIGSIWDNNMAPPTTGENGDADLNDDGKNALHFFKSRSGAMLIFDDTDGKEKIQLISSESATRIEFSVDEELVEFASDKDLTLGAKGAITFDAEEINITASKQFNIDSDEIQLKASKTLDITADQDITIKGSGVALN